MSAVTPAVPLIEAEGLHTYYGDSHILHGVSLKVHRGETISLMGRNGMGKTTTLRSLIGLTPPGAGQVLVKGEDTTGKPPHRVAKAGVAYVPEDRGIFPTLSVRENLIMAARSGPDGRRDWDLERVLDLFPRLAERINKARHEITFADRFDAVIINDDLEIAVAETLERIQAFLDRG